MPFRSEAQRKFMFAKHPAIAKRWAEEYPESAKGNLPEHVKPKPKKKAKKKKKKHSGSYYGSKFNKAKEK